MNTGRFVGAAIAVWLVRTLLNAGFYGYLMHGEYESISARYPGAFREVVPAFIAIDLVVAFLLTWLIIKAAPCFGGGIKAGVTIAILIAILCPVIGGLYYFFSTTYYTMNFWAMETVFQIISHAIQGAIAAAIYKPA
ncbi:MAG TPA: hypothetical protein VGG03_10700 [Thermoanaerobaculia bacterium]|jgi:uncharacterized membrane protein (DUF485 family)